jgi:magnesium chelatase family protein
VVARYQSRLSGPLADRIDVHVAVGAVPLRALDPAVPGDTSATMRGRVDTARAIQHHRYDALRSGHGITCNAHAPGRWLQAETPIAPRARDLLVAAAERLALSARGFHRVLKVARTIADLEGDDMVGVPAVAEALRYRPAECGAVTIAGRRGTDGAGAT